MSDETEMNPELEQFAAQLRCTQAPEANVDRDQLMYDAGWAAAMSERNTSVGTIDRRSKLATVSTSFVSGLAIAACIMFLFAPVDGDIDRAEPGFSRIAVVESNDVDASSIAKISEPPAFSNTGNDDHDLMDWVDNIPQGHSFSAGFSSRPALPDIVPASYSAGQSINPLRANPTSRTLLREFVPTSPRRDLAPNWATWFVPGA